MGSIPVSHLKKKINKRRSNRLVWLLENFTGVCKIKKKRIMEVISICEEKVTLTTASLNSQLQLIMFSQKAKHN